MAARTIAELMLDLRNFLGVTMPEMDATRSSLVSDIVLRPWAVSGQDLFGRIEELEDRLVLESLEDEALDVEAINVGLVRQVGTKATGIVTFFTRSAPEEPVTIAAGSTVSTRAVGTTAAISFVTTSAVTLPGAAAAGVFFNFELGRFEINAPIESVSPGLDGNVSAGSIIVDMDNIVGIDGVENAQATTSGTDAESDDRLRDRIRARRKGRRAGVRQGIRGILLDEFQFASVGVVSPRDPDKERLDGTDAWVVDESEEEAFPETGESYQHFAATPFHLLSRRPVKTVSSVISNTQGSLTEGTDYIFRQDATSGKRLSTESLDGIEIKPQAGVLDSDNITVNYTFSRLTRDAQTFIDQDENNVLADNILVKRAIRVTVNITASVSFFAATDLAAERIRISSALLSFFEGFRLGDDVEESDLVVVIQTGFGDFPVTSVDQVIIQEIVATDEFGTILDVVDEAVRLTEKQFARFGAIAFV